MAAGTTARARKLRKQSTDAEKALWRLLRNRQLVGCKFRRQVPLGNYIVDFLCYEESLVIEIDGGHHQLQARADAERTAWLQSRGFRVIRFWNNQVLAEPDDVLDAILGELRMEKSPSP
jgi:very-short-patch-repair endonuclease